MISSSNNDVDGGYDCNGEMSADSKNPTAMNIVCDCGRASISVRMRPCKMTKFDRLIIVDKLSSEPGYWLKAEIVDECVISAHANKYRICEDIIKIFCRTCGIQLAYFNPDERTMYFWSDPSDREDTHDYVFSPPIFDR